MKDLVDDRRGELLDLGALGGRELAERAGQARELGLANAVDRAAQPGDGGYDLEAGQPLVHAGELFGDDAFGLSDLALALVSVGGGHALQIVDVVQIALLEAPDGRVEVAGHGDVDHEQRTAPAAAHDLGEAVPIDDESLRGGQEITMSAATSCSSSSSKQTARPRSAPPAPRRSPACGWRRAPCRRPAPADA